MAAYTRGAWLGGVIVYFVFASLRPGAMTKVFRAIGLSAIALALVAISPLADRISSVLPILGSRGRPRSSLRSRRVDWISRIGYQSTALVTPTLLLSLAASGCISI